MTEGELPASIDDVAERALRDGLRAEPLSAAAMQRVRAATEAAWRAATRQTHRSRTATSWAAAAALAMVAVAAGWLVVVSDRQTVAGERFGQIERAAVPVSEVLSFGRSRSLVTGSVLRAGQRLQLAGNALIELQVGGNLRVASGTAVEIFDSNALRLERGVLYVDMPPNSTSTGDFVVTTPAGQFTHLGTQFEVAVQGEQTELRVREGRVAWRRAGNDNANEVTAAAGTALLVQGDGSVTRESIATTGREWAWAEALAPDFDIENRPLAEFLEWVARESGRRLVVVDAETEKRVATTILHGSIHGLNSLEALATVMQTTALHFDLPDGVIRVSSTGALPPVSD
ncbi:MAG: FecR domain-containing protein [Pseudomonadales bacterium]|nr:FecR domain-containing protein [Pseudomonadales bacterium]